LTQLFICICYRHRLLALSLMTSRQLASKVHSPVKAISAKSIGIGFLEHEQTNCHTGSAMHFAFRRQL